MMKLLLGTAFLTIAVTEEIRLGFLICQQKKSHYLHITLCTLNLLLYTNYTYELIFLKAPFVKKILDAPLILDAL